MTTELREATKRKACELANAEHGRGPVYRPHDCSGDHVLRAFARLIQEFSDVADEACMLIGRHAYEGAKNILRPHILPNDPDPLEKAWKAAQGDCGRFLCELRKNGLKIVQSDD